MHVIIPKDLVRLSPDVEVTLFRIIQESLTNVHRYSGSATASIRIHSDGKGGHARNQRLGKAIRSNAVKAAPDQVVKVVGLGVGIQGMRERMRQLGGRLEIDSQQDQGTIVTAVLPVPQAQLEAMPEAAASGSPAGGLRKRILIADDHEVLRQGVRMTLQGEPDWEVCGEAADGKEAVEKALALNPDLVIVDINMPLINGLDTVRRIRRDRPHIKALVFTVHESDQTVREIIAAGAQGYLSKAQGGRDLVKVVKNLFAGNTSYPAVAAKA